MPEDEIIKTSRKIRLYLTSRSIRYLLKHPSALKNIRFSSNDNYSSKFVSNLLSFPEEKIESFTFEGTCRTKLVSAFQDSIAPSTGEMPTSLEESLNLYHIIRILKPKYVVETGVSAGRSSSFILCALSDNDEGELYSIDPNPDAGYAIPAELKGRWNFINATSEEALSSLLDRLKKIDMFLHDSLHSYECMTFEYNLAWSFIREGGILLSDDVDRNFAFVDFCKSVNAQMVYLSKDFAGCKKCV